MGEKFNPYSKEDVHIAAATDVKHIKVFLLSSDIAGQQKQLMQLRQLSALIQEEGAHWKTIIFTVLAPLWIPISNNEGYLMPQFPQRLRQTKSGIRGTGGVREKSGAQYHYSQ
jgi:hypothetical protein